MTEKELKELEKLAKAAMEHNPQESEDILEQALIGRKDEMWQIIQKKARRRVRARKVRPWIAAAAVVMMAVIISGAIGINQARAGKEGLLVDIVEGVAGKDITFSGKPLEFKPITVEDGTWEEIMDNIDSVMIPLLPEGLPEKYVFESGAIDQGSQNRISMSLKYTNSETNNKIRIRYIFSSEGTDFGTETYESQQWGGTVAHIMTNNEFVNIAWQPQEEFFVEIFGLESEEEGRIFFDAIKKEP
jgi:hypothetical protein